MFWIKIKIQWLAQDVVIQFDQLGLIQLFILKLCGIQLGPKLRYSSLLLVLLSYYSSKFSDTFLFQFPF